MSKLTLLGVAVVAAVVIGSGTLAWVHNGAATADHENATNYVVGPDGRLIGAAPNPSIRSQWERDGLPINPKACGSKKPQGFLSFTIEKKFPVSRGVLQPAGLTLDRPYSSGHVQQKDVSCCSDLDLINVAKLSAGRRQLSPSLAWHRLFSQQQRLTFFANRPDIDVGCAMSALGHQ